MGCSGPASGCPAGCSGPAGCSEPARVFFLKMEFLEELFSSLLAMKGYELA